MKITFLRPHMFEERSSDAMEPLCFAILKSRTPHEVETVLYDERLEPIPYDEPTDLVALTVEEDRQLRLGFRQDLITQDSVK